MLVEDEPDVRALLVDTLHAAGYCVIEAANGQAALDIFRDVGHRVDVVVSDVIMPRMGGAEIVRVIRGLRPGLPAILMSGYTAVDHADSITADAITRFIQKPFLPSALSLAIAELLAGRDPEAENAPANF